MSAPSLAPWDQKLSKEVVAKEVVPVLTTLLAGGPKEWIKSVSNLLQGSLVYGFVSALQSELSRLRDQGKISQDYFETSQGKATTQELLKELSSEAFDEKRLEALRRMFIQAATAEKEAWQDTKPVYLMQVIRKLSGTEIIILSVSFDYYQKMKVDNQKRSFPIISSAYDWPKTVAAHAVRLNSKLSEGIVSFYENPLIENKLIGERTHQDRSGFAQTDSFRLTPLALEICEYLSNPEP